MTLLCNSWWNSGYFYICFPSWAVQKIHNYVPLLWTYQKYFQLIQLALSNSGFLKYHSYSNIFKMHIFFKDFSFLITCRRNANKNQPAARDRSKCFRMTKPNHQIQHKEGKPNTFHFTTSKQKSIVGQWFYWGASESQGTPNLVYKNNTWKRNFV